MNRIGTISADMPEARSPGDSRSMAAGLVNEMFTSLKAAFPAWRYSIPDDASLEALKITWTQAFLENDISRSEQIEHGLRMARKSSSSFFPSVGEFIEWCSPSPADYGLPGERAAYVQACKNSHDPENCKWSHPAVFVAGRETGFFDLSSKTEKEIFAMFRHNYAVVCKRVIAGQSFDSVIPKALPKPPVRTPSDSETAGSHLADIMSMLK